MADGPGLGSVLLLAAGCAVVLAATHTLTADRIVDNSSRARRAALVALVDTPGALPVVLPALDHPGAWRLCDGSVLVRTDTQGYGGRLELLYTIAGARTPMLQRLRIIHHEETPGITDFLREPGGWLATLAGQSADGLAGVAAVTGATITSHALTDHLAATLADPAATLGPPLHLECPQ